MAISPGVLGKRYTPLLVIAAVQVVLVAIAPSNNGSNQSASVGTGSSGAIAGSTAGQGGAGSAGAGSTGAAAGGRTPLV